MTDLKWSSRYGVMVSGFNPKAVRRVSADHEVYHRRAS